MDTASELRTAAIARGKAFAVSEPVTVAADIEPPAGERVMLRSHHSEAPVAATLSDAPPLISDARSRLVEKRAALQRLWRG